MDREIIIVSNNYQAKDLLFIHPQIFENAIRAGIAALNRATTYHPINTSGTAIWSEIVAALRAGVVRNCPNWRLEQQNGLCMLVNNTIHASIVVSSGDSGTGRTGYNPCSKNGKGKSTEGYVGRNFELWDDEEVGIDHHKTWVFLYHIDRAKDEARYELCLPDSTRAHGRHGRVKINGWRSRVIFEPISISGDDKKVNVGVNFISTMTDYMKLIPHCFNKR